MITVLKRSYDFMIKSKAIDIDARRREFILNTLLAGLIGVTIYTIIVSGTHHIRDSNFGNIQSLMATVIFLLILVVIKLLVARRHFNIAAYLFVGIIYAFGVCLCAMWGFTLPVAQLLFALCIVSAGILISSKASFKLAVVASFTTVCFAWMESIGFLSPNKYWTKLSFGLGDAYGFVAIFIIMGLISWLSNREIERSMKAERELANNLETTLAKRSRELEQTQLVRVLELQRFAELGKISASLLHQVANPLTAANIDLQQLNDKNFGLIAKRTRKNLDHLERYLAAARQQLAGSSNKSRFSVGYEILQVASIFESKCNQSKVKLTTVCARPAYINGDSVKFNQLMANIIGNAVDSYVTIKRTASRKVIVETNVTAKNIEITVTDNGCGIHSDNINKLYDAFYTTKTQDVRGMGIGLTIARQFIEKDFGGRLDVSSSLGKGSKFVISIPNEAKS